jgi:hypothetical protein
MDMLIKRTAPGTAEVFTLEITELGFSMLAWPAGPPTVFGALTLTLTLTLTADRLRCAARVVPRRLGG